MTYVTDAVNGANGAYFLTVEWCGNGARGIMCDRKGRCFRKDDKPHTTLEMHGTLGPFWVILDPQSELFTKRQTKDFILWMPLEEYSYRFGIALRTPVSMKGIPQ